MGTSVVVNGANASQSANLPQFAQANPAYVSGRSYMAGPDGVTVNATNTNLLTTNTIYGVIVPISAPVTISSLICRTSSSNASSGAAVKMGIYNVDSALVPTSLIAQTPEVAITNSATSTVFSGALTATLAPGIYLFALIPTATTTGMRTSLYSGQSPWNNFTGGSNATNAMAGTSLIGYTGSGTYASGLPATFPTPTAITAVTNHPILGFTV